MLSRCVAGLPRRLVIAGRVQCREKHSKRAIKRFHTPIKSKLARLARRREAAANPRPLAFTDADRNALPFSVERTDVGQQLPVYIDYKNGRTRVTTILRKYRGDTEVLADEMKKVCRESDVEIRPGRIEAHGHHREAVKQWLTTLGF